LPVVVDHEIGKLGLSISSGLRLRVVSPFVSKRSRGYLCAFCLFHILVNTIGYRY
ncbi:MAG: hypothetical protein ACI9QV_000810, partial [Methylophagaceae bacterium]